MKSSCGNAVEIARARPLLGTFVEIRLTARNEAVARAATNAAFDAVARVHACMSPREPDSDLSRLAREHARAGVAVDPWTWRVLAAARQFSTLSGGLFDVTDRRDGWREVRLLDNHRVALSSPVRIDLGGIAKGFAVDRAVEAARRHGAIAGIVNAGGDLRAFGPTPHQVAIRSPRWADVLVAECAVQNGAIATSSNALDPVSAGRIQRPDGAPLWIGRGSVTMLARTCMTADALCKIVAAVGPDGARALLRRYQAETFILDADGRPFITKFADAA